MKNIEQQSGETTTAYLTRCARVAAVLANVDRDWTGGWIIELGRNLEVRCAGWNDTPEETHATIEEVEQTVAWCLFVESEETSRLAARRGTA